MPCDTITDEFDAVWQRPLNSTRPKFPSHLLGPRSTRSCSGLIIIVLLVPLSSLLAAEATVTVVLTSSPLPRRTTQDCGEDADHRSVWILGRQRAQWKWPHRVYECSLDGVRGKSWYAYNPIYTSQCMWFLSDFCHGRAVRPQDHDGLWLC